MNNFFENVFKNNFKETSLGYIYHLPLTKKEVIISGDTKNRIILYFKHYNMFLLALTVILGSINIFLPLILLITIPIYFLFERVLISKNVI